MADPSRIPSLFQQAMQSMESKNSLREAEDRQLESTKATEKSDLLVAFAKESLEVKGNLTDIEEHLRASASIDRANIEAKHQLELAELERKHEREHSAAQHKHTKALEEAERELERKLAVQRAAQALREQALVKQHEDRATELKRRREEEDVQDSLAFYRLLELHSKQVPVAGPSSVSPMAPPTPNPNSNYPPQSNGNFQLPVSSSSLKRKERSVSPQSKEPSPAGSLGPGKQKRRRHRKSAGEKAIQANSGSIRQDSNRIVPWDQIGKRSPVNQNILKDEFERSNSLIEVPIYNPSIGPRRGEQVRRSRSPERSRRRHQSPDQRFRLPSRGRQNLDPPKPFKADDLLTETRNSHSATIGYSSHISAQRSPKSTYTSPQFRQSPTSFKTPVVLLRSERAKNDSPLASQTLARPGPPQQISPHIPQHDQAVLGGLAREQDFRRTHHQLPLQEEKSIEQEPTNIESQGPCGLSAQKSHQTKASKNEQNTTQSILPPRGPQQQKGELRIPPRQPANFRPSQSHPASKSMQTRLTQQPKPPTQIQSFQIKHIRRENGTPTKVVWKPSPSDFQFSLTYHPHPIYAMKPSSAAHRAQYPEFEFSTLSIQAFELNYRSRLLVLRGAGDRALLVQKESGRLGKTSPLFIEFLTENSCRAFVGFCKDVLGAWQIQLLLRTEEQMITQFRSHGWSDGTKQLL